MNSQEWTSNQMIKKLLVLLLLQLTLCLSAKNNDLALMIDNLLNKNPDYQQTLYRYEREKSALAIDRSVNWFEINFLYRQYENQFTRDETVNSLEHSEVDEKFKMYRVELSRQLFPKDFDNVTDIIGARINLLRFQQAVKLDYSECVGDIFDDMIRWYKAETMITLLQGRLDILQRQNLFLESMYLDADIDPDLLIENIEEINKRESDLQKYKETSLSLNIRYGSVLNDFVQQAFTYLEYHNLPDTITFMAKIDSEIRTLTQETAKLSNRLKLYYTYFYLPEINLSLSYNWREIRQTWDIEQNNVFKRMIRIQTEEYPRGQIELSLPLDLYSNTGGKLGMLKAYNRDLQNRSHEIVLAWRNLSAEKLNSYHAARHELIRRIRLSELYERNLELQRIKYKEEPSLLGGLPEQRLQLDAFKAQEALMESRVAELKLCKQVFLIQKMGEDLK